MSKTEELHRTSDLVMELLKTHTEARNSDDYLYFLVCEQINPIASHLPFRKVILNRKQYQYPPFESVRRSRQKIQAEHPELSASGNVEAQRMLNEEVFRDYARS